MNVIADMTANIRKLFPRRTSGNDVHVVPEKILGVVLGLDGTEPWQIWPVRDARRADRIILEIIEVTRRCKVRCQRGMRVPRPLNTAFGFSRRAPLRRNDDVESVGPQR